MSLLRQSSRSPESVTFYLLLQVFACLWRHIDSALAELLDSEKDQSPLIHNQLRALSAKIDLRWACLIAEVEEDSLSGTCSQKPGAAATNVTQREHAIADTDREQADSAIPFGQCDSPEDQAVSTDGCDSTTLVAGPAPDESSTGSVSYTSTAVTNSRPHQRAVANPSSQETIPAASVIVVINADSAPPQAQITHDSTEEEDLGLDMEQQQTETEAPGIEQRAKESDCQASDDKLTPNMQSPPTTPSPLQLTPSSLSETEHSSANYTPKPAQVMHEGIEEIQVGQQLECASLDTHLRRSSSRMPGRNPLQDVQTPTMRQAVPKRRLKQNTGNPKKKLAKTNPAAEKSVVIAWTELEAIPQDVIKPVEVYERLASRCNGADQNALWLMTQLFYAIASPNAFDQLRDACLLVRETGEFVIPQQTYTVTQTIQALEGLEMAAITHSILRRYYLTRLIEHRNEREKSHVLQRPLRRSSKSKSLITSLTDRYGRVSSLALSDLMAEAYPELKQPTRLRDAAGTEYKRRHKSVKNMLGAGKNWYSMQQAFSPGILALVPTGRDCGIQNSE